MVELTIDQALRLAIKAHKAGQVREADRLYTAILKAQPKHPDANHNMGLLTVSLGKVQEALPFFKSALETHPNTTQFWLSYIDALIKLEQWADAKASLSQARSKGAKGDDFDKLAQKLKDFGQEPLGARKLAVDTPSLHSNILDSLKLDQAISLAKKKAKAGSTNEAKRIYQDILVKFPKNKSAIDGLKSLAGRLARRASKAQGPSQSQQQAIIDLYNQGQHQQALQQAGILVQKFPKSAVLFNIQGSVLKELGQLDASVEAYNKAVAIKPDYADAYNNMGNALKDQHKLEEAIAAYRKTLAIKPDYAEAYNNLGNALKDQAKLDEALEAYRAALSIKPDLAKAYNNMGNALTDQHKLEEAMEAYNKAVAIKPDYVEAWSNGGKTLEKWNRLKELDLWLKRAFQILEPVPSDISFMKAKLLWRNKNRNEAAKIILNIDIENITPNGRKDFLHMKAKCYEALNDYDLAYDCFQHMNSLARKSDEYLRIDAESYFQKVRDQLASLKSGLLEYPINQSTEQSASAPVFLVGFPRSGTTLMDTILRSHSNIDVVEEKPAVISAKAFITNSGYTGTGRALPQEIIAGARQAYIAELDKHKDSRGKKAVLIDKLPLNLLHIPLIHQLYPQAKFILALRHPLDTILSCWMQNFKLNSAMANMVDLDRIVEFYCAAMEIFKICRDRYNLNVHQIKYEDLIEDFNSETSTLLKFLDLDWEVEMENYQETALKRGFINTPSYSQVIQPIYKEAKYRWLHYEKHLTKYSTAVEPWIREYGYSK